MANHVNVGKDALCIAHIILQDILTEVTGEVDCKLPDICDCDILCAHRDIAALVRLNIPDQISTNFTLRHSRVEVLQLKCLEQRASGYCGHYAVFFALKMLEALNSQTADGTYCSIKLTAAPVPFWKRYWRSILILLHEAVLYHTQWWPWTRQHIQSGDMERSFLTYLLSIDPYILTLNTNDNIHVLHYAYGLIQSSEEEVCSIQQRITRMKKSQEDQIVFILGVTNHWVILVVQKIQQNRVCAFYLDSNNEPVLMATESQLDNLVQIRQDKHMKRKGQPYTDWKRKTLYQSFVDQRDVVNLLVECVTGEKDLRGELVTESWTNLLDSYYQFLGDKTDDPDLHLASLIQWLEQYYPTQIILSHHVEMLQRFHNLMDKETMLRLHLWLKTCSQHTAAAGKQIGLETVESFYSVIDKIKTFLDQE